MCERRKIKNATSVLIDNASNWWDNLCEFDKPRSWNDMKTLMRETFVHISSCEDKEDSLEEDNHVVPLVLPNLLQDIHPYKVEDEPDMLIASCEIQKLHLMMHLLFPLPRRAMVMFLVLHSRKVRVLLMC